MAEGKIFNIIYLPISEKVAKYATFNTAKI